jgi:hypothetical protein
MSAQRQVQVQRQRSRPSDAKPVRQSYYDPQVRAAKLAAARKSTERKGQ